MRTLLAIILLAVGISFSGPLDAASRAGTDVLGKAEDWANIGIQTLQYAQIREMVRNAYIEVQTWRAIKANWERQKNWFDRNKRRWERIKQNLHSAATEGTVFQRMRRLGDVTKDVDEFAVVETQRWDNIVETYEDNASQMWDVAGNLLHMKLVPADDIWAAFHRMCKQYSLKVGDNPTGPGEITQDAEDIYLLDSWRRRRFLGRTFAVVAAQNSGIQMGRGAREAYWNDFAEQMNEAMKEINGKEPLADAINGQDLLRRTQNLADVNDLILQRTMETQLLMALAGDRTYKLTAELSQTAIQANEAKMLSRLMMQ